VPFAGQRRSGAAHIALSNGLVSQLSLRVQRSGFPRPPDLPPHLPVNLTGVFREELMCWLIVSEVRRAAVCDDLTQARFLNAQNFRNQLMKSGGVLDQQVLWKRNRCRSAVEALETAETATGAEDLTQKEQHDTINL
jgi:hypothetical protein